MTLIKTSLLNAIAVVIKMLTLLGINKVLAIYVGPAGYAAIGQFQNAVQMIITFASGAINNGVIKYTAEYDGDSDKQRLLWATAGTVSIVGSIVISLAVLVFSNDLAVFFLKDAEYKNVFIYLALSVVFFVLNTLFLSILNGKKEIKVYVLASIFGSLFSLAVTVFFVLNYGLYGALVSLAIYHSLSFVMTLFLCYQTNWFRFSDMFGRADKTILRNLFKYTVMALTSAICLPLTHMLVRNHIGETIGWESAGYWEAMWRLSSTYLMIVTTTLSVYYLPKLSELKSIDEIKREICYGYKIILPVAVAAALVIYIFRDLLIEILFSSEFSNMESLFAWQVVGDALKIGSWILAYVMISKAIFRFFIVTEVLFSLSFYLLAVVLTESYGLEGVSMAHALNYLMYWIVVAVGVFKVYLIKRY